jgi:hypothetical protein
MQRRFVALVMLILPAVLNLFGSGTTAIVVSGNRLVFINNTSTTPTITVVEK